MALGFGQVWTTTQTILAAYPNTFRFLVAYMFYVSGIASTVRQTFAEHFFQIERAASHTATARVLIPC